MLSESGTKPALRVVGFLCFTEGAVKSLNYSFPDGYLSKGVAEKRVCVSQQNILKKAAAEALRAI